MQSPLSASSNCSFLQYPSCINSSMGSRVVMRKRPATNHGDLDCPKQNYNMVELRSQDDGKLRNQTRPSSLSQCNSNSNTNPTSSFSSFCCIADQILEEGQGECNGDHVRSISGAPTAWNHSEGTNVASSWRRSSPAATSSFVKDVEEEQEYFQQVLGSSSRGWTDEKHSSYLDSMEADFLRSVMFKAGSALQPEESSSDLDDCASSHQAKPVQEFKVCQNGRWRPVYVQAPYASVLPLKQLAVRVKNPWIKRFRATKMSCIPSLNMEGPLLEEAKTHCEISSTGVACQQL